MRNTIITSLALAATVLAATPALAADAKLTWKDLDLNTDAGKAELGRRIDAAAAQVCTTEPVTGSRLAHRATSSCLAEARAVITERIAAKTAPGRVASNAR